MFALSSLTPHTRIQLHVIKSHAASNLNRDDLGRPKEMTFGATNRLRLSSQSIKRAIRTGEVFDAFRTYAQTTFGCSKMVRTTLLVELLVTAMENLGMATDKAKDAARAVKGTLSNSKDDEKDPAAAEKKNKKAKADPEKAEADADKSQLLAVSMAEIDLIAKFAFDYEDKESKDWAAKMAKSLKDQKASRFSRFLRGDLSPEMMLFGRMVTSDMFSDVDAQVQVAHAFTVHEVQTERDYWTGVDDHREATDRVGSGMIDVRRFGAGVFYQYACIDVDGLLKNIADAHVDLSSAQVKDLTRDLINAFILGFAGQNPTGYQNSFASNAMPEFMAVEIGGAFPHSAAAAYEQAIEANYSAEAADRFKKWIDTRNAMYGAAAVGQFVTMGLDANSTTLEGILETVGDAVQGRPFKVAA